MSFVRQDPVYLYWEGELLGEVSRKREWVIQSYASAGDTHLPANILSIIDDQEKRAQRQLFAIEVGLLEEFSERSEKKRRVSDVAMKIAEYIETSLPLIVERIVNQLPKRGTNEQP